jgi:hypothetical protein
MNRHIQARPAQSRAALWLALPLLAVTACAEQVTRIPEPIGPAPASASFFDEGRLVVHTAARTDARSADEVYGANHPSTREFYTVVDRDGHAIRSVYNQDPGSSPDAVTLQAGQYLVRTKDRDGKRIEAWVQIVPGRTTEVFLDRSWTLQQPFAHDSLVRAPDGTVVGWRANAIGGGPRESLPR